MGHWQELDKLNKSLYIWQSIDFNLVKKRISQINNQVDKVLNQSSSSTDEDVYIRNNNKQ